MVWLLAVQSCFVTEEFSGGMGMVASSCFSAGLSGDAGAGAWPIDEDAARANASMMERQFPVRDIDTVSAAFSSPLTLGSIGTPVYRGFGGLLMLGSEAALEVGQGFFEAFAEGNFGLPAKQRAGLGDVGTATGGVVLGQGLVDNRGLGAGDAQDFVGAFQHGELAGIADVDGRVLRGFGEAEDAGDEVGDIAEAARL